MKFQKLADAKIELWLILIAALCLGLAYWLAST